MLTRGRITNREGGGTSRASVGEDEEAVAGGLQIGGIFKPDYGLELSVGGPVIEGEDILVAAAAVFRAADDREGWAGGRGGRGGNRGWRWRRARRSRRRGSGEAISGGGGRESPRRRSPPGGRRREASLLPSISRASPCRRLGTR